jgi:hypothetical protein
MSGPVTIIECEEENHFFSFFNFIEHPGSDGGDGVPMLYFSLGFKVKESGIGLMLNDVRLKNGVFQNPYHSYYKSRRAYGYLNKELAVLVQNVWTYFVVPRMPKWRLQEEAWKGLLFDEEKMARAIHAPYKVFDPSKPRVEKKSKGRKVNFA